MTVKRKKLNPLLRQEAILGIMKAREKLYASLSDVFKGFGITEPQYNVLRILRGAGPDGLPCLEIGRRMITRVPDITRLLDRLEALKLISRSRSKQDRRVITVQIGDKGLMLLNKLEKPLQKAQMAQFENVSERELAQVIELMNKITSL